MATVETIHSHGAEHFDDLQLSAKEFYTTLESMVKEYQFPNVKCTIEELKESGLLSAKRQYLAISWNRHKYLVCASPFGRSFFISWWHQEGANTGASIMGKFGLLGKAVANNMESRSFYEIDSELMFKSSINAIIQMAIDKVKVDKGYKVEQPKLLT